VLTGISKRTKERSLKELKEMMVDCQKEPFQYCRIGEVREPRSQSFVASKDASSVSQGPMEQSRLCWLGLKVPHKAHDPSFHRHAFQSRLTISRCRLQRLVITDLTDGEACSHFHSFTLESSRASGRELKSIRKGEDETSPNRYLPTQQDPSSEEQEQRPLGFRSVCYRADIYFNYCKFKEVWPQWEASLSKNSTIRWGRRVGRVFFVSLVFSSVSLSFPAHIQTRSDNGIRHESISFRVITRKDRSESRDLKRTFSSD